MSLNHHCRWKLQKEELTLFPSGHCLEHFVTQMLREEINRSSGHRVCHVSLSFHTGLEPATLCFQSKVPMD